MFPYDYAAAERHWLRQYNPTTFVLDGLAGLGLVSGRRRTLDAGKKRGKHVRRDDATDLQLKK